MVGATTTGTLFSMMRAARCDTSWTQRQSTMLGRCGPCCSVAPIGTMTTALRWASALISEALSLDQSISDIYSSFAGGAPLQWRVLVFSAPSGLSRLRRRCRPPVARLNALQRRQRLELHAEPLLVQPVDLAVHHVEEDEAVEPLQQIVLAHPHAHVRRAAADGELEVEFLARIALLQVRDDQAVGGEQLGLAGDVSRGG